MNDLLLRTLKGETTPVKPVWMMRQAGRYLPEYRELRARFPEFLDFVHDARAAALATAQPVTRFGLDAAILFSDILVTLPPMGFDLNFIPGKGPRIANPLKNAADVRSLSSFDCAKELGYTREAIERTKLALPGTPLLGFVGGPLTLASYAIEGETSKDLHHTKALFYTDGGTYSEFLDRVADVSGEYLVKQAEWGCDALVIMDSWAGILSAEDYRGMAAPYTRRVIEMAKRTGKPVIHYANGAAHLLPEFLALGATAFGLDWRTDLEQTLKARPGVIFQGNLDPALLFAPEATIREKTKQILTLVKDRPHIMNLGHGVLPGTPVGNVLAFVDAIRNLV
jgi:uroporphyrinogen decarboxylase